MKLRTELVDGELVAYDRIIDPYAPSVVQVEYLKEDAMAAHAYKQAIADWHEKNGTDADADVYPETTVAFIEKRAAEILAGWLGEEVAK